MTYTSTTTRTFTRTSARHIASKVVTDLRRMNSYYGKPPLDMIDQYFAELTEMLAEQLIDSIEYGFKRNGKRIVSLFYEVRTDGTLSDSRAGGVYARTDISGAAWFSFLTHSYNWYLLSESDRKRIEGRLPFQRTSGDAPRDGNGYWVADRSYAADDVGTQRSIFRPY